MANQKVQLKDINGNLLFPKTNLSEANNDANFITSAEAQVLITNAITGKLTKQIVTDLPTEDIDVNTIYLKLKNPSENDNIYDEYMYINSDWEIIGNTKTDLSDYYTQSEVDTLLADKANSADVYTKSEADTLLALKAPLASPALTGNPTCPSPSVTNGIANKSYVDNAVSGVNVILYDVLT